MNYRSSFTETRTGQVAVLLGFLYQLGIVSFPKTFTLLFRGSPMLRSLTNFAASHSRGGDGGVAGLSGHSGPEGDQGNAETKVVPGEGG